MADFQRPGNVPGMHHGEASSINYDLIQHPDKYSIFPGVSWDTSRAKIQVTTNAKGRGKVLVTGPKDSKTGVIPKGFILLPKNASADESQIKTEYTHKDGFWIHVPKMVA